MITPGLLVLLFSCAVIRMQDQFGIRRELCLEGCSVLVFSIAIVICFLVFSALGLNGLGFIYIFVSLCNLSVLMISGIIPVIRSIILKRMNQGVKNLSVDEV